MSIATSPASLYSAVMVSSGPGIFGEALVGDAGTGWNLGRLVAVRHPDKALLDGVQAPFDLLKFASAGKYNVSLAHDEHACICAEWCRLDGLHEAPVDAIYDVEWANHSLRVVLARWFEGAYERTRVSLVVASSMEVARAEYERYGAPWKRGVLLVGPPGNGKTLCLRALIKFLGAPCLYLQSLKSQYGDEDAHIELVFHRAKEIAPCCLVFEDLDAMIHDKNRSLFLNQLDGLESASGLLTIATTNHADRLDPAIVERPSRFDRKYHFLLPGPTERRAYLAQWNGRIGEAMRVEDDVLDRLVERTADFSFAHLKELTSRR